MKTKDTHKEKLLTSVSDKIPRPKPKEPEKVLTPEEEGMLQDSATRLMAIGRRSTEQAFDYGLELAKVQAILPAKRFGSWLKANVGISTKSAKNYTRVHFELASFRDRMENLALAPSAMFALLGADELAIDDVLEAMEGGQRLTVEQIKAMIGGKSIVTREPLKALDMPGRAGCMKVAQDRLKTHINLFYGLLDNILVHVEQAVTDIREAKRLIKKDLLEAVAWDCRHASDVFELTLAPIYIDELDPRRNWKTTKMGKGSAWGRLQKALHELGSADSWRKDAAFQPWLVDEIYPLLKFAVRGEALLDKQAMSAEDIFVEPDAIEEEPEFISRTTSRLRVRPRELRIDNVVRLTPRHDRPGSGRPTVA